MCQQKKKKKKPVTANYELSWLCALNITFGHLPILFGCHLTLYATVAAPAYYVVTNSPTFIYHEKNEKNRKKEIQFLFFMYI